MNKIDIDISDIISTFVSEESLEKEKKHSLWKLLDLILHLIYSKYEIEVIYDYNECFYYSLPFIKKISVYIVILLYGDFTFRIDDFIEHDPKGKMNLVVK